MVDIIVAVGGRLDWFRKCITAVRRNTDAAYRLIVVDDCGNAHESERLVEILGEIPVGMNECETPELIRHEKRVGYTLSANDGLAARGQGRSVVLLNTDAVVGPNWLSGMVRAATGGVGYVNPVSNRTGNGFDIPMPPGESLVSMSAIVSEVERGDAVDLYAPTGFCLLCTAEALSARDQYDVEKWPIGYGEETEHWILGMRDGINAALATSVFVFHSGGQSFGMATRDRLGDMARKRLLGEYGRDLQSAKSKWESAGKRVFDRLRADVSKVAESKRETEKTIFALWSANANAASSLRLDFGGVSAPMRIADEMILQGHDATIMMLGGIPGEWQKQAHHHLFSVISGVTPEASATRALSRWSRASIIAATMGSSYAARDMADASDREWAPYAFCQDDEPRFHEDTKQPNVFDANFNKILEARRDYYRTGINGVCVSKFAADAWRRYSGTDPVAIIPPGVDTALFVSGEKPERPVVVGFHRKHRRRNPVGLAATFQLIREQRPDAELVAIGKDGMPLPGVRNTGELDQVGVARELARAHVLIEPSIYQGFGLPALEAMACGCVPVCAANGGIDEYGVNGENCLIVENEPKMFASAALRLISESGIGERLGLASGGVMTAKRFAVDDAASRWTETLKKHRPNDECEVNFSGTLPVTAVMVTHGRKHRDSASKTARSIASAKNLIVVDSDSRAPISGANVRSIEYRDAEYAGKVKAANIGIWAALSDESCPEYIYVTMNDVVARDDAMESMCRYLDEHPECGCVSPTAYTNGALNTENQWDGQETGPIAHFENLAFMARASVLRLIVPLDEDCRMAWGTSLELPTRVWRLGYTCAKVVEAKVDHLGATTNGVTTKHSRQDYFRSALGEWGVYLAKRHSGDFVAALNDYRDLLPIWSSAGVPEKSVEKFLFEFREQSAFFMTNPQTRGIWRKPKKPVVLIVTFAGGVGGVEYIFGHVAEEYERRGYDVVYAYWFSWPIVPWVSRLPHMRLPDIEHGFCKDKSLVPSRVQTVAALYDMLTPQAVITYYARDAALAKRASKFKPTILEWVDGLDPANRVLQAIKKDGSRPDWFVCETENGRELVAKSGANAITSGPPIKLYAPAKSRDELGLPGDKIIVLRVARLVQGKGPRLFNDMMRELGERYLGVWIGPDDGTNACAKDVEAAPQNAKYIGPVMDQTMIASWIESADVVVSTTATNLEGMSSVLIESLCRGKIVVATDSGYTSSLIQNGVSGVVVPLATTGKNMARAVASAIEGPNADAIREAARKKTMAFSLSSVADSWQALFDANFKDGGDGAAI